MFPSENFLKPGSGNADIEQLLIDLPDKVADAYVKWQHFKEEREQLEAIFCLQTKAKNQALSATELKWEARKNDHLYKLRLDEIVLEGEHMRLLEKHLSNKKRADMRSAF